MGGLQESRLRAPRVGEGALLEAEHLGFEQSFRNCGAVDVDEWALVARSRAMDLASQKPLAGSRLTFDQDGRQSTSVLLTGQEPRDLLTNRLDARTVSEQIREVFHGPRILTAGQYGVQLLTSTSSALADTRVVT